MSWGDAFLRQARGDDEIRRLLNRSDVAYSHRLHYLQMVTEKLAKGLQADTTAAEPPLPSHRAFVRLLQVLKGRPDVRRWLGFADRTSFRASIDSLLGLARHVENLAPSSAGFTHPNPEYPWRDPTDGTIHAPVDFQFELFDPRDPRMIRLEMLVRGLLAFSVQQ